MEEKKRYLMGMGKNQVDEKKVKEKKIKVVSGTLVHHVRKFTK